MSRAQLRAQLITHEGLRLTCYTDTVGKRTIGVGRNLDDVGITRLEALRLLDNDLDRVEAQARHAFPWFDGLDEARQDVILNMLFNLGLGGLQTFKKFLNCVSQGRYEDAAREMLASKWATQVGQRAQDLAQQMRTGERA
jgi:lysozyme